MSTDRPPPDSTLPPGVNFPHTRHVPSEHNHAHTPDFSGILEVFQTGSEMVAEMQAKERAIKDAPTAMEKLLEHTLDEAAKGQPETEQPTVQVQIWLSGGDEKIGQAFMVVGAVKRGPVPRTYILGASASDQNGRPIPDKLLEVAFWGGHIIRFAALRDIPKSAVVGVQRSIILT